MILRKGSLKPGDDSPFVNEIFDPDSTYTFRACAPQYAPDNPLIGTDKMYNLPSTRLRDSIRHEYINTNYSVVNPRTIDAVSPITWYLLRRFLTMNYNFL